ncbi:hypothetical protein AVEN_6823-1 [Araneus ventricosus]|uniref:DUF5641 domain-containing protein n=1 Tax=Araneus ventricosus TaxID=182803 RepID=A0A4Y2K1R6_ARAVE|nr:hypothetical protein AVEN_6823-1 [Araneus ventricosus]
MTRYIHSPSLKTRLVACVLSKWQALSGTIQDGGNANLWIERSGLDDVPLLPWLPRSPDLTPCDFSLWGYEKDKVYVPSMPTTLQALQERITVAVTEIDGNMLLNVWTELDYRWDVCRVTKGAHIELCTRFVVFTPLKYLTVPCAQKRLAPYVRLSQSEHEFQLCPEKWVTPYIGASLWKLTL